MESSEFAMDSFEMFATEDGVPKMTMTSSSTVFKIPAHVRDALGSGLKIPSKFKMFSASQTGGSSPQNAI